MGERPEFLTTAKAGRWEHRLALAVVSVSVLIFIATAPFARVPLPKVWAFIPMYEAALAINELITAVLLFAHARMLRSRALLMLACGYLFTSVIVIPHALTFPGLFAERGLLGAGPQSTAWLYMFWHGGFPIAVIAYALFKGEEAEPVRPGESTIRPLLHGIAIVVAVVATFTLLATAGQALLPAIMRGDGYSPAMIVVVSIVWALSFAALLTLWLRPPYTKLDLWLMVVMCAWIFDVALSAVLNAGRFDLGFYAGRVYGLLAATFVLVVLLLETAALYTRLAWLFEAEQEEHRSESEQRRRIFETSLDLILVTDRRGKILQVSPSSETILGYSPKVMIGRSAREYLYPGDLESTRQEMRLARRGRETRNFDIRYVHRDGRVVPLAWSGVWSEPEQQHFFIGRDVTERKRAERLKDEFVATVSHELRTPLTSISGSLGLLVGGVAGGVSDPTKRLLTIAYSNSRRLVRLVNDILDIQRLELGQMEFDLRRVEVKPLIEQAIEANSAFSDSFQVRVRLDANAEEAAVRADPDRLTQVIINLLSNAVKFSPSGQEVVVSIATERDRVCLAVRDHGAGIPDDFKSRIFEKFAQADGTDTRQHGGTGLGLSIVKQIVNQLGGDIGFKAADGDGTVFHVDLPRWDPQTMADPDQEHQPLQKSA